MSVHSNESCTALRIVSDSEITTTDSLSREAQFFVELFYSLYRYRDKQQSSLIKSGATGGHGARRRSRPLISESSIWGWPISVKEVRVRNNHHSQLEYDLRSVPHPLIATFSISWDGIIECNGFPIHRNITALLKFLRMILQHYLDRQNSHRNRIIRPPPDDVHYKLPHAITVTRPASPNPVTAALLVLIVTPELLHEDMLVWGRAEEAIGQ